MNHRLRRSELILFEILNGSQCAMWRGRRVLLRSIVVFTLPMMLAVVLGCGSDLPQTVKVTGQVKFDGQSPPGAGIVYFLPTEAAEGFPLRPATGDFGSDGKYSAATFEPNDGVMPGKYKVYIECWETAPNMEGKPVKSFVPKKYQTADTSGLEMEVTRESRAQVFDIDIATK